MAQLNLTLPEQDVQAIRELAAGRSVSPSTLVRDAVLGEPVRRLSPDQVERLDELAAVIADATSHLSSLDAAVEALQGSDPLDQIEALDRRLSALEEIARY